MILSHRHRMIFLKTAKTAGTTIELSLCRSCGPDDVVTAVEPADEEIRRSHGGVGPQHHEHPARVRDLRIADVRRAVASRGWPQQRDFWNHITAYQVRERVPPEVWDGYHKVAFVRNPWDRALSLYSWERHSGQASDDLDTWVERRPLGLNWAICNIDGRVVLDQVGRYESLVADVTSLCERVGIVFDGWLPAAKSGARTDRRHYREVLSSTAAATIARKCAREIQAFGYEF